MTQKNPARTILVSSIASALIGFSYASAANDSKWLKEPTSVLGIKLGVPVKDAGVPNCRGNGIDHSASKTVCLSRVGDASEKQFVQVFGLPFKDIDVKATLFLYRGKTASIHFDLPQSDAQEMLEILVERYGSPSRQESRKVSTIAGATLVSKVAKWNGANNSIHFFERFGQIDDSLVVFENNELDRAQAADDMAEKKSAASGL